MWSSRSDLVASALPFAAEPLAGRRIRPPRNEYSTAELRRPKYQKTAMRREESERAVCDEAAGGEERGGRTAEREEQDDDDGDDADDDPGAAVRIWRALRGGEKASASARALEKGEKVESGGRTTKPGTSLLRRHSPALQLSVMCVSPKMSLKSWFMAGSSNLLGSPVRVENLPGPLISSVRKSEMSARRALESVNVRRWRCCAGEGARFGS